MQFDKAYEFLMEKLEKELPANLFYHNARHTKNVVQVAGELGELQHIDDEQLVLLKTAALFHDAGFLESYKEHEEVSCLLAKRYLPGFEYTEGSIEDICELIMSTKIPQRPGSLLSNLLCDADLSYLGTAQYSTTAEFLYAELIANGDHINKETWHKRQIEFLQSHAYFSEPAKSIYATVKAENLQQLKTTASEPSNFRISKTLNTLQDGFLILLGVVTAGFALKGFLVPNNFFDGGVTGISLLMHELYHFNLAYTILAVNLPLIIISYFGVSKSFAIKTLIAVVLLGVCLLYLPYPIITSDKLLISIFGGFFLGVGIGLTIRAGCALDGVEVLALYTLKRSSFTITEIILGINVIIFVIAAFKFGLETSLYSILTYFTASRTIDFVIEGIEAYTGVTIISSKSEMIKYRLVNELGRGITVYKGERGFLPGRFEISSDVDIIFTVITRLELRRLKNLVYDSDPKAFVFANTIKDASGGIIKRRRREH